MLWRNLRVKNKKPYSQLLDHEKAAETLSEAEPRAQRQLVANLRRERASMILAEMTMPQLVNLFSVLPHDDTQELLSLLPPDEAERIRKILAERESTARTFLSTDFATFPATATVGSVLAALRQSECEPESISYLYIVLDDARTLTGVVDLRELVLAPNDKRLSEIMVSPVVSVEDTDSQEDLAAIFERYHYRLIPVVDVQDRIVGVIRYNDLIKSLTAGLKS